MLKKLLAERGIEVDHVTIYRWVQRFTPLVIDVARPCRHSVGDRWFVAETYVKVAGVWRYVYRAVDQHGQVIEVLVSKRRDVVAATKFFEMMLTGRDRPREVTTVSTVTARGGRPAPRSAARHRPVWEQPDRVRSRPAQGTIAANARSTNRSDRVDGDPQPRVHSKRAARPLELGVEARHKQLRVAPAFDEHSAAIWPEGRRHTGVTRPQGVR
jgi:transposase-like protein